MFVDMHVHALSGVDDGAETEKEMYSMIDIAYQTGTRVMCVTPHCSPHYFGIHTGKIEQVFRQAKEYVSEKYKDFELCLGNELRYSRNCLNLLVSGDCKTLNNTRYLLVDFAAAEKKTTIIQGVNILLNAGYIPVIAHVERYVELQHDLDCIEQFQNDGALIQMDAQSLFRKYGFRAQRMCKKLLDKGLVNLVASDAHDARTYIPDLSKACHYVAERYGDTYANAVFKENAMKILHSIE